MTFKNMGDGGGMAQVRGGKSDEGAAQKLLERNRALLEISPKGKDVTLTVSYKGRTSDIVVPEDAVKYAMKKGEIPDTGEVLGALDALETAEQRALAAARQIEGGVDPLDVAACQFFRDARDTHILNLVYCGSGEAVDIRNEFREEFNLSETDRIARKIAGKVLSTSADNITCGRREAIMHKQGATVIDLDGLGVQKDRRFVDVTINERVDRGSHVESRPRRERLAVTVVSMRGEKQRVGLLGGSSSGIGELLDDAMRKIPRSTIERYGDNRAREIFMAYVNSEYLVANGSRLEAE